MNRQVIRPYAPADSRGFARPPVMQAPGVVHGHFVTGSKALMILAMCLLSSHIGRIFEKILVGFHIPAVLCWIAIVAAILGGTIVAFKTRIGSVLAAIVGWLVLTSLFSIYHRGSLDYTTSYVLFWVVLFLILAAAPRNFVDLKMLFYATSFACFLNLALTQRFSSAGGRLGLMGTFGNADDVGLMAGFAIPFWIFCASQIKNRLFQILVGLMGLVFLLRTVALTATRAALLGLVCMFLIYLLRSGPVTRIFLVILVMVATTVFAITLPKTILERFKTISDAFDDQDPSRTRMDEAMASVLERRDLQRDAIKITMHHPVLGVGPGQFGMYRNQKFKDPRGKPKRYFPSHNTYLQIASEQGIPGILLYLALLLQLFRSVRNLRKLVRKKAFPEHGLGGQMVLCMEPALIYFAFCAFFMTCDRHPYIFVLAGLSVAFERLIAFYHAQAPASDLQAAPVRVGLNPNPYLTPLPAGGWRR